MGAQDVVVRNADAETGSVAPVHYRLANTRHELEQAFALVRDNYISAGLHDADTPGVRLTKYHLLPGAKVFIATRKIQDEELTSGNTFDEQVIGTLTVIADGPLGLPAEHAAPGPVIEKRRNGVRMAEIIALAANKDGTRERAILKLFRLAYDYCCRNGITEMVASLTERHIGFYRRFLGFQPMGELTKYKMANGLPVQVHCLPDVGNNPLIEERSKHLMTDRSWREFWIKSADSILELADCIRPWSPERQRYFSSRCPVLSQELDDMSKRILSREYHRYGAQFDSLKLA